jgi:hypothetical protein
MVKRCDGSQRRSLKTPYMYPHRSLISFLISGHCTRLLRKFFLRHICHLRLSRAAHCLRLESAVFTSDIGNSHFTWFNSYGVFYTHLALILIAAHHLNGENEAPLDFTIYRHWLTCYIQVLVSDCWLTHVLTSNQARPTAVGFHALNAIVWRLDISA